MECGVWSVGCGVWGVESAVTFLLGSNAPKSFPVSH